jgi:hypothetical protein
MRFMVKKVRLNLSRSSLFRRCGEFNEAVEKSTDHSPGVSGWHF